MRGFNLSTTFFLTNWGLYLGERLIDINKYSKEPNNKTNLLTWVLLIFHLCIFRTNKTL